MTDNPTVVSAKQLLEARHQKQISGFHKKLMSDISDIRNIMGEAIQKHRDAGTFNGYEPGTRLLGQTGAGPKPFKITGHSVRDWDKNRMAQKAFESKGIEPTLIEHEGRRWLPMLKTESDGGNEQGEAYLDMVKAAGYPKMGITK